MAFDIQTIDFFESIEPQEFERRVFRATRIGLDPRAPSVQGGRWMIPGRSPVLYTSMTRDGALGEIRYHWSLLTPPPTKPVILHELAVHTMRCVRLDRTHFAALGISDVQFGDRRYTRTQEIGAAAVFFGFDGLVVPSARSEAENLVILSENHSPDLAVEIVSKEEIVLSLP